MNSNFLGLVACFVISDQCLKAYGSHYQSTLDFCQYEHTLSCFFLSFIPIYLLISLCLDRAYSS